jgi:cellobiose phosphorylase
VSAGPVRLESPSGLVATLNRNGSLRRLEHRDVVVNTFPGTEMEGGPTNLWLRRHGSTIASTPLLGPRSPGRVALDASGLRVTGEWEGIRFAVVLVLAESAPAWFWHVRLENVGAAPVRVDLVHAQDVSLAPYGAIRMNEYYVSQYLDHVALTHAEGGVALAVRQNLAVGDRNPWALVGALGRGVAWATDALQLHGFATRAGAAPAALAGDLPSRRLQHEHAMAVLQDEAIELAPGAVAARGFFGWLEPHHADATGEQDVAFVDRALALPEAAPPAWPAADAGTAPAATLFSARPVLAGADLDDGDLPQGRRHVERDGDTLLSFFTGAHEHVVLPAKERASLRPHGHIVRTGDRLAPEEASLTSTAWMDGVFHSLVTQGHVNINRVLSTVRSYLGLSCAGGLRIFVERADGWHRLGLPSLFTMTPSGCTWTYRLDDGTIRIDATAETTRHALTLAIESTSPRRFLLSHHVALGGDDGLDPRPPRIDRDGDAVLLRTDPDTDMGRRFPDGVVRIDADVALERVAGDEALFLDGRSRQEPYLVLVTAPAQRASFRLTATLIADDRPGDAAPDDAAASRAFWRDMASGVALPAPVGDADRMAEILPWFAHDALIHFLAPRGLEQYSGGGWGTRDVCQGPVELLLALGRFAELREMLLLVFANQNPDGDWPQWWTFFERDRGIRAPDAHGDIVFWPIVALAQYLLASDDGALLDVEVPFFDFDPAKAERATVLAHVQRALDAIAARQIPGTSLCAYGHGDWNDSLQPVDPVMRERLCSSWTVTLQYQTATTLAAALRHVGRAADAAPLDDLAARTLADFQRLLVVDDTLAGFAWFHEDGRVEPLLHPQDARTGIRYRLLPMIHAIINDLLTPAQAKHHVGLMRDHLLAADGARLFDRPPEYRGGLQRIFQRAETSTFFGREIGIMYVHAHLRYAEAMARHGDADAFWLALRQAVPIGLRDVVPNARLRQASCYTSSSDAAVADRYEAQERYADVRAGAIPVEGGWRVYSSGAGIACRLIHQHLLGIRRGVSSTAIDPVLPPALDGLGVDLTLDGRPLRVEYRVGDRGAGVTALTLNGTPLPFEREANPYRLGAAVVPTSTLRARRRGAGDVLVVQVG